ncbi:c-type cytochrome [Oricola sp.]|uniref:c-type cytochrome n=1 Tax=Oricola sp. TaxID=1979950 RepID=UPI003BAD7BA4
MTVRTVLALAALAAVTAFPAVAQMTAGEIEFRQACASCHGMSGKGDGPVASHMSKPVPDLTNIKARNDGDFPFQRLLEMVDGRLSERQPGPHGTAMPVWGDRFMMDSGSADPVENEINTLGRMTSLIYYVYSLQQ